MPLRQEQRVERHLAAIFAADVAGYSRLVGLDELGTLKGLASAREVMDTLIEEHGGRIANTAGDSVLAEFPSAVDAVQCGVAVQGRLLEMGREIARDRRVQFRIGIHVGDVVARGRDLLGDGVNVGARLQEVAEPGGVCISGAVYEQVHKALPFSFKNLGLKKLKNIDRAVQAYAVSSESLGSARTGFADPTAHDGASQRARSIALAAIAVASLVLASAGGAVWWMGAQQRGGVQNAGDSTPVRSDKPSVAVLPFSNLSDDKAQEYFSDGITDDVINELSKVAGLFVVARNSTFTFKNTAVDVRKAAADLGVRYVVEGSVRRAADRIRINVRLVDAASGGQLWADRYEGAMGDVFGLQDEIAGKITRTLAVQLTSKEQGQIATKRTENPVAYDEFLKGWNRYLQQNPKAAREAIGHFERAIEIEPNYSRAFAALAATYWQIARRQWQEERFGLRSVHDARLKAEEYITKAQQSPISLNHQVASAILSQQGMHEKAIKEGERAISMDPNDANAYVALAGALSLAGQPAKALELVLHGMRLNPFSPPSYFYELGLAQFGLEQFQSAAASLERAIALNSDDRWAYRVLLAAYGHLGRKADAERIFSLAEKNRQGLDPLSIRGTAFWYPFKDSADWERMATGLRLANVPD
ncbi:adenylate/guanylate cyclase domain-containing protein [Bradyrhizobium sp. NBAIM03]|uniref:adenylate/guanylate cyclase domain-containing protein n=1 Tax=unclassified Bradyrhizobium TaxID=2631580 RepID=UPI001CD76417|nr:MULTISPECIES: adenylate/guanylate cyclase domain-containing protein [unclassified Bradyrhizobium]MCA1375316.1 adenylate/guanylate cyclase domain-containing protein [Bradyrhizobium sp. IC4060]MCA1485482.1 adenylate/guanylate cyclase domain-containing protein [Bradyrhizobium sp. IC4061]MCA1532061.1 adenylate/guanylate cyclase domain-containing protein [Bradyrhizobium sp. NBAIM03]MCA1539211.1 adenylate/guanylate cyclase domain-containing protein [Bradyrhizobium sp. NBAIM32]